MVVGTDCIGSCESNYHTITTTTLPRYIQIRIKEMNTEIKAIHLTLDILMVICSSIIKTDNRIRQCLPTNPWNTKKQHEFRCFTYSYVTFAREIPDSIQIFYCLPLTKLLSQRFLKDRLVLFRKISTPCSHFIL